MLKTLTTTLLLLIAATTYAQKLQPGFEPDEYATMLRIAAYQVDSQFRRSTPKETEYTRAFRGTEVGMHNKWDLWLSKDKSIMVVNLRGTTSDMDSWLENFYSAMIPATGKLVINKKDINYKLAADPKATVHVGWTIGMCCMAPEIMDKINEYYKLGTKQVIIAGHSQGGALSFLLTSYLHYKQVDGLLPKDLVMKTYCSAAPKPGNLYYAYDFDNITRGGWAFKVVNTADWVPETPVSVQTVNDFNPLNPFIHADAMLGSQKWYVKAYLKHVYKRLSKTTHKAQHTFEKYTGRMAYTQVKKYMPGLEQPHYSSSANFMRAGTPIVLQADADYYKIYPDTGSNIFRHHLFGPYLYLLRKTYK